MLDLEFAKILMVRQCIGRATLNSQKGEAEACREVLISNISYILRVLFPISSPEKVRAFATKVADKSISLRNAMTEEQAVYRCRFVNNEDSFDRSIAKAINDEKSMGTVMICLFPGLCRLRIGDNFKKEFITVVHAIIKLNEN